VSTGGAAAGNDQRIRALFSAAGKAATEGRAGEAEGLLRQAEQEAPRHPLVLNEAGQRLLRAGDARRAHEAFTEALKEDAANAALWVNLAAALRGLGRHDEELQALDRALAIEPANLRAMLQKASAQELRNDTRAAAFTYRRVLQSIPPGAQLPAWMRDVLAHGREVVAANNQALEAHLEKRLTSLRANRAGVPLRRFDRCLAILMQRSLIYQQQPTFLYFPELPAIEFFDRAAFPWLDAIEAATDDIRAELVEVLAGDDAELEPYISNDSSQALEQKWRTLNKSRRWSVYYLWREGVVQHEHLARCPRTAAALAGWPRCEIPGSSPSAVFSILDARTRIPPHTGVNNTRLLVHLPLIVPPGCGFRVGGEQRQWVPGQAFVFDDTIEHEAWNDSDEPRAIMIFDIWNPAVSAEERAMVSTVVAGMSEWYGTPMQREG
jgi:aspartyl/asparaginyl beta-hydroxylase (cupin superfamily)/Tfp pilus assembly protein PilF